MEREGPRSAHAALLLHYGPLDWWPGDSPFEIAVGAILTQNTAWDRVERALDGIKAAGLLDPHLLHGLPHEQLAEWIRPSGTFRIKAGYLRTFLDWLVGGYGGDLEAALRGDTREKRRELLALRGVGRETADSILLYAGGHPIFVVDAYTRRIFSRHHLIGARDDYDLIRTWFEERLPADPQILNELHAWIVNVGKDYCRPRAPRCASCPMLRVFGEPDLEAVGGEAVKQ